jgi:putative FmdB family regulatory protein
VPTYEYRCKACGQELEVVQSFTDDALTTCEACGGPLRKVFGSVGIAFKGSGFYKNDSRGKSSSTAVSTETSSDNGSSSSDGGGTNGTKKDAAAKSDGASTPAAPAKADKAKAPSKAT